MAALLPQMSLEIRAAVDGSLQKELAALRGYISSRLDSQSERIQGDIAAALHPPRPAQDFDYADAAARAPRVGRHFRLGAGAAGNDGCRGHDLVLVAAGR
jgi:hypothetical protein